MKTGIILLNMGGPDTPAAIRPFLYNLFSDRQIIQLGPEFMQKTLARIISTLRASKARKMYAQIGGASPIVDITEQQADKLGDSLKQFGDFEVYFAMRYWHPFTEEAVVRALRDGVDRVIGMSLYPQYSVATTGSSETRLWEVMNDYDMPYETISSWYDHPKYIDALVDVIKKGLGGAAARENADAPYNTPVLFSAHSLPQSFVDAGDPYPDQVSETIKAITDRIDIEWSLGYQSRSAPVKWMEPSTMQVIRDLARDQVPEVLVVPISFVSDHIETLYEIDIMFRDLGESLGIKILRTESLNTRPLFIEALRDIVMKKMRELGWVNE